MFSSDYGHMSGRIASSSVRWVCFCLPSFCLLSLLLFGLLLESDASDFKQLRSFCPLPGEAMYGSSFGIGTLRHCGFHAPQPLSGVGVGGVFGVDFYFYSLNQASAV